ncbi:hypothetical protein B0H19DRAFT_1067455 [Mycena capillaripes]|nr:hypothetical protein B0H19DRAFT_1067455 [Mycena capillaripes]
MTDTLPLLSGIDAIGLPQSVSPELRDILKAVGAVPTRVSLPRLYVHQWHIINTHIIYPQLCHLIALLKIVKPDLLDQLFITILRGHIFVGVHNSFRSIPDFTVYAVRALTKKAVESAAGLVVVMRMLDLSPRVAQSSIHFSCDTWGDEDDLPGLIDTCGNEVFD